MDHLELSNAVGARIECSMGALGVSDMIRSAFGPFGADKVLIPVDSGNADIDQMDREYTITNDGATMLQRMETANPAAKALVDMSKYQDKTAGDGTTGAVLLCAELIREAERLTETCGLHPHRVIDGYQASHRELVEMLRDDKNLRLPVIKSLEAGKKAELDWTLLHALAVTTLTSKLDTTLRAHVATMCIEAMKRLYTVSPIGEPIDLGLISILQVDGGTIEDSFVADGVILKKDIEYPPKWTGVPPAGQDFFEVLVANTQMDTDKIKIMGTKAVVSSLAQMEDISKAEKSRHMKKVTSAIKTGCNVFVNRQLVYDYQMSQLMKDNVAVLENADFEGVETLSRALGTSVVSLFGDNDNKLEDDSTIKLGRCKKISTIQIGNKNFIHFDGCAREGTACLVLRGPNPSIIKELERSIHDAVAVLNTTISADQDKTAFVGGGGAIETALAARLLQHPLTNTLHRQMAVSAANCLMRLPVTSLSNGGYDGFSLVEELLRKHQQDLKSNAFYCVDGDTVTVRSAIDAGIYESLPAKISQISCAFETACMILRIDGVIRCPPRQRGPA